VVEWDGLENRCARKGTVGSNPTPSVPTAADSDRLFASTSVAGAELRPINMAGCESVHTSSIPTPAASSRPDPSPPVGKWGGKWSLMGWPFGPVAACASGRLAIDRPPLLAMNRDSVAWCIPISLHSLAGGRSAGPAWPPASSAGVARTTRLPSGQAIEYHFPAVSWLASMTLAPAGGGATQAGLLARRTPLAVPQAAVQSLRQRDGPWASGDDRGRWCEPCQS
jgi:hypothetical protein